jgi:hypothetical protein
MLKTAIIAGSFLLLGVAWAQKPDEQGSQNSTKPASAPAVQTKTYKGTLVDASCGGNVTQNGAAAKNESSTADRTDAGAPVVGKSGATNGNKACAVSAATKEFALRMNDGHVLRFDSVGNERAQDAIKNNKKWNSASSSGKSISAKVTGTQDGDNLTVTTLD